MFDSFVAEQIESIVILHYRKALQVIEGFFIRQTAVLCAYLYFAPLYCYQ